MKLSALAGEKTRFDPRKHPSVANAGLILWNLGARLEAAPFQNGFTAVVPSSLGRLHDITETVVGWGPLEAD